MGNKNDRGKNFYAEEEIKKSYDIKLLGRLLTYVKPYWKILLISTLMLFVVSGAMLARPYVIKIAIDDHISGFDTPMRTYQEEFVSEEHTELSQKAAVHEDKVFIRETDLPDNLLNDSEFSDRGERYQIVSYEGDYFLASGIVEEGVQYSLSTSDGEYSVETEDGEFIPAARLSPEEVQEFRSQDIEALWRLGIIFFLIVAAAFVFNVGQLYLLHYASEKIIFDMRQKAFTHLQKMSLKFFDTNPLGRLVTRVTNDTEKVKELFTNVLVNLFRDILLLLGIVAVMLHLNYKLALICFAALPLIIGSAVVYRIKARKAYRQVRVRLAKINASFQENISGIRIIQAFNREKFKSDEFDEINSDHYRAGMSEVLAYAIFRPTMDIIFALVIALLLWYGGGNVIQGVLQFGVLYAFINYTEQLFRPINDMTEKYNIFQSAMAASERIFMLFDERDEVKQAQNPKRISQIRGDVAFENVWFAYNPGEWVLKNVSFRVHQGETVALVGATGAGKTSVINLLERFYDVNYGRILIDGIDIREIDLGDLRKKIGVVLQDVFLFSGSIRDNIALYNKELSDEEIKEIARYVGADEFIERMPEQYHTHVKERGVTLSLGQRQLLAFARALAGNPDVVVLDEATANVDTQTEAKIQELVEKVTRDKTTIVIAHRLSTIRKADRIIVLHGGQVREEGTHLELIQKRGIYYNLYRLQYHEQTS